MKELKTSVQAEPLQEFLELAFSHELLKVYQENMQGDLYQSLMSFHHRIANEMLEHSNSYWLVLRGFFNHLMFAFATKPCLMATFEQFVLVFGTARELRSLDAEIKLYKLQTLIPEVIPKKYERCNLEAITYQGAYIRTMTMIIVEGIIKSHLVALVAGERTVQAAITTDSLETLLKNLLLSNLTNPIMARAD